MQTTAQNVMLSILTHCKLHTLRVTDVHSDACVVKVWGIVLANLLLWQILQLDEATASGDTQTPQPSGARQAF